ncbi:malate:quinone oxidoreductase, partial [Staphylococcus saprophyticus]|uniref:malate:quinone oxidoreductase n=1 Tax=Staphylococcus saprophyticus TaxID=29385 RepID=UPI00164240C9
SHLAGFPITRQFLISTNPHLIQPHHPKLYPKQPQPTPPITVPHLHTPYIHPQPTLLFPPFPTIPPKFLKQPSNLHLFKSLKP